MARTEPGRHWQQSTDTWEFAYRFPWGIHPFIRNRQFHFNPGFLLDLWIHPPGWLLVSGSWYFPTAFLAGWLARRRGVKTLFWNESNLVYVEHASPAADRWRGRILGCFDGYVVPGAWASEYILHYFPAAKNKPFLQLPNVVDEKIFRQKTSELRLQRELLLQKWQIPEHASPLFLCIARLDPIKGIEQLIQSFLSSQVLGQAILVIAGEGSLKDTLKVLIAHSAGGERVRLLGYVAEADIVELLAIADAFVLPSLGDPYPLAVIEAAFAGLPLLLSNKVGCHPEALVPEENGFLFDPYQPDEIRIFLEKFVGLGKEDWENMGRKSAFIAEDKFETTKVIHRFVQDIQEL